MLRITPWQIRFGRLSVPPDSRGMTDVSLLSETKGGPGLNILSEMGDARITLFVQTEGILAVSRKMDRDLPHLRAG